MCVANIQSYIQSQSIFTLKEFVHSWLKDENQNLQMISTWLLTHVLHFTCRDQSDMMIQVSDALTIVHLRNLYNASGFMHEAKVEMCMFLISPDVTSWSPETQSGGIKT